MGQKVKLTESLLHKMINETIKEVLSEGTWDKDLQNMWMTAENTMGAEEMLNALYSFLDNDTIEEFIQTLKDEYDIDFGIEDEDFEDEVF